MLLVVGDKPTVVKTLSAFVTAGQALCSPSLLHCLTWAPIQPSPGLGIHSFLFLPFSSCSLKENENLQFLVLHPSPPTFPPPLRIKPEAVCMLGSCIFSHITPTLASVPSLSTCCSPTRNAVPCDRHGDCHQVSGHMSPSGSPPGCPVKHRPLPQATMPAPHSGP